jgi:hypothetical protein
MLATVLVLGVIVWALMAMVRATFLPRRSPISRGVGRNAGVALLLLILAPLAVCWIEQLMAALPTQPVGLLLFAASSAGAYLWLRAQRPVRRDPWAKGTRAEREPMQPPEDCED